MRCHHCGRKCSNPCRVVASDGQRVKVGYDCWRRIKSGELAGYRVMTAEESQQLQKEGQK